VQFLMYKCSFLTYLAYGYWGFFYSLKKGRRRGRRKECTLQRMWWIQEGMDRSLGGNMKPFSLVKTLVLLLHQHQQNSRKMVNKEECLQTELLSTMGFLGIVGFKDWPTVVDWLFLCITPCVSFVISSFFPCLSTWFFFFFYFSSSYEFYQK